MTDINLPPTRSAPKPSASPGGPEGEASEDSATGFELMELLFFAYRDFISDPDQILRRYNFGRAHHRVVHFVWRNPGIRVAELLDILKITKQSLGRVLQQLIRQGFIYQREGATDRRQRLLFVTDKGRALALSLAFPQISRIRSALSQSGPGSEEALRKLLTNLVNSDERDRVLSRINRK